MISVVTWKWKQEGGRSSYDSAAVNTLHSMVRRNYPHLHNFVCVTDDTTGLDRHIVAAPLPDVFLDVENPLGPEYPRCHRRLALFGGLLDQYIEDRFVSMDLDCVVVDDLSPLWDRDEDIVFWESPLRAPDYNGSMVMAKKGAHPELYDDFDPFWSPVKSQRSRKLGSDQGWYSYRLPGKAVWTHTRDGVYAWNPQLQRRGYRLPQNARIVFFPGNDQPWHTSVQTRARWVNDHYR